MRKRIERGHAGGYEIAHIASDHGQPVFKRRCSDHEIDTFVTEGRAQNATTPRRRLNGLSEDP